LAVVAVIFMAAAGGGRPAFHPRCSDGSLGGGLRLVASGHQLRRAIGIFLFGLTGPFAAAAMQRFGIRATVIAALAMMSLSSAASLFMTQTWQLILTWGVVSASVRVASPAFWRRPSSIAGLSPTAFGDGTVSQPPRPPAR